VLDGASALRVFYDERPALVVLDLDLGGPDGWTILERVRELSEIPLLILTSRSAELEKVQAFRAGADDYVTKPFGNAELLARVDALLRRTRRAADQAPPLHDDGVVRIDFAARAVEVLGEPVRLTPTEFRLLTALVRHPGQVLSRTQIQEEVWGGSGLTSGDEVRVYIGYLRRKLGDECPIETVRGFGYRYDPEAVPRAQVR
jgi:DNA-binding response OmpR family regulator